MNTTLNYTNKAKESVTVVVSDIDPRNSLAAKGFKSMIDKIVINGVFISGCTYVKVDSEGEIKTLVSAIRKDRISRLKNRTHLIAQ